MDCHSDDATLVNFLLCLIRFARGIARCYIRPSKEGEFINIWSSNNTKEPTHHHHFIKKKNFQQAGALHLPTSFYVRLILTPPYNMRTYVGLQP